MKIHAKKLALTAFLALCFATCLCLFAACGKTPKDTAVTYTVTVLTGAESPASGVKVQIGKGSTTFESKNTDENGKAEFELAPDSYDVTLSSLPAHYSVPEDASLKLTDENRNLTVTLAKNFAYTVSLVNPDGTLYYAQGVSVGICTLAGNCLTPVALEADGTAIIEADASDYHVKVSDLPANAYVECDSDGYYTGEQFSATKTEMEITVYPVTAIDLTATGMTDNEKAAYAQNNGYYNENEDAQKYKANKITKELAKDEVVYFAITPAISGKYGVYVDENITYQLTGAGNRIITTYLYQTLEAEKPFYIKATNEKTTAQTAELVITSPYSSYVEHKGVGGNLELTVGSAETQAIIAFTPTQAGTYTLTVKGEALAYANTPYFEPSEFIEEAPEASDYVAGATAEANVSAKEAVNGTIVYFSIAVKATEYPLEIDVNITKTAESNETYEYAKVTEKLTQYTKAANTELYDIPLDGTAEDLVYNPTDRFYHYGAIDGPVVVVNITGKLDTSRFYDGAALAYMEIISDFLATYEIDVTEEGADGKSTINYTVFLRGFNENEYKQQGRGKAIPDAEDIETEVYYAKYVNEDGVYPLTEELKVFLELFLEANKESFLTSWAPQLPTDTDPEDAWMFPLFYYGAEIPADAIVGTYKLVSVTEADLEGEGSTTYNVGDAYNGDIYVLEDALTDGKLTADSMIIKLSKKGGVLVLTYDSFNEEYDESYPYDSGTWTKDGETYTFELEYGTLTYENGTFTYTDTGIVIVFEMATVSE